MNHIMALLCYFKTTQDTGSPVSDRGTRSGGNWGRGGGVLRGRGPRFEALMERAAKTKINSCRVDENSLRFRSSCLQELCCFSSLLFSAPSFLYLLPDSLIHARALYHTLKQGGNCQGGNAVWLGIKHPPHCCAPTSQPEQWPFSIVPH